MDPAPSVCCVVAGVEDISYSGITHLFVAVTAAAIILLPANGTDVGTNVVGAAFFPTKTAWTTVAAEKSSPMHKLIWQYTGWQRRVKPCWQNKSLSFVEIGGSSSSAVY